MHNITWATKSQKKTDEFQKKLMSQSQENLWTEGWKDGRKGRRKKGQTLIHRTLPATAGGPKRV